jgi:hypothetical protein
MAHDFGPVVIISRPTFWNIQNSFQTLSTKKRKTAERPAVNLQNHLSFMVELDGIEPTTS